VRIETIGATRDRLGYGDPVGDAASEEREVPTPRRLLAAAAPFAVIALLIVVASGRNADAQDTTGTQVATLEARVAELETQTAELWTVVFDLPGVAISSGGAVYVVPTAPAGGGFDPNALYSISCPGTFGGSIGDVQLTTTSFVGRENYINGAYLVSIYAADCAIQALP
jgi:hypothetical protein